MKTTLLLSDFSANARHAADYAIGLQGFEARQFMLVNIYVEPFTSASDAIPVIDILEADSKEGLAQEVAWLNEKYAKAGIQILTRSEPGGILFAIERLLDDFEVDTIVIGAHGSSKRRRPVMGNNAAYILKHVKIPVIVVPSGWTFQTPGHILLATDNESLDNADILSPMTALIRQYASKVSVLTIRRGSSESVTQTMENPQLKLLLEDLPHVYYREWENDVVRGLISFIHENGVDMVCLVERKLTFFKSLFHSSVTKQMSSLTDVPMLVLHD